jgi:hypothetical protein
VQKKRAISPPLYNRRDERGKKGLRMSGVIMKNPVIFRVIYRVGFSMTHKEVVNEKQESGHWNYVSHTRHC